MKKYLTEFIGTFVFLFVIALAAPSGGALTALAIGTALMVVVYMGGHISGGHYNPAVTLGLAVSKKCPWADVIPYWICQFAGAAAAFSLGGYVYKDASIQPAAGVDVTKALIVEIVFTLGLVLTVLNVACTKKTAGNSYYGLAIGFAIVIAAIAGGPISGGAFNPAVGFGATLAGAMSGEHGWTFLWIYMAGPFIGALIAAGIWRVQNPEEGSETAAA